MTSDWLQYGALGLAGMSFVLSFSFAAWAVKFSMRTVKEVNDTLQALVGMKKEHGRDKEAR